jgi:putative phosphonate metabolism protein
MGDWRRHAIYFAPPEAGSLARFGAAWLGWDPRHGLRQAAALPDLPADRDALIAAPRRYGFHATLKAPFRLAGDLAALDAATAAVAAGCQPFQLRLHVGALGPFLALLPDAPPAELHALEAACVTGLDAFRAPPNPSELERRRAAGLDPVEEENLRRWGYPYVLDRFRFHLTLTGPLPEATRMPLQEALTTALAPNLAAPVPVTEICRFSEADDGVFRLVRRFPLG